MEVEMKKENIILISIIIAFFIECLLLIPNSQPGADEGTHNLLGLFFFDFFHEWMKSPTFSVDKIYDYFINYLIYYPKLSLYYPPLLYIILSLMFNVFGISFFVGSLTILLFSVAVVFMIFLFSKKHLNSSEISLISSLIYVLSPAVIFLSIKTLIDIPLLFFFLATMYSYLVAISTNKAKWFLTSAIFFALGFLTKWNIVLVAPIIFIYTLFDFRKSIKKLILSFLLVGVLLSPYLYLAFKFNIPVIVFKVPVEAGIVENDPQWTSLQGWLYYLIQLSNSYLSFPLLIISLITLIFYARKKEKHWKLFLLWFVIGYLFFTWLQNKDPRYILIIFPSLIFPFVSFVSSLKKEVKLVSVSLVSFILIISSFYYIESNFNYKIDFNSVTSQIKKEGNVLVASENSWFYSSSFMFNLASKEGRFLRKVYRPCVLDKTDLKSLLNNEGIRYVIVAEPVRDVYMKNFEEINKTQQLHIVSNIEGKNVNVIIYENFDYHNSISKCNYVCVLNEWMCLNSTNGISILGANS
jgi:hypothetical protein